MGYELRRMGMPTVQVQKTGRKPKEYLQAFQTEEKEVKKMKWLKKKKPLRELCREAYGDDFARKYDDLNRGIPIGNFAETIEFLEKVAAIKKKGEWK